jgi:hypothetical protein
VDEAAEQVPSANISRADRHRIPGFGQRWGEAEGTMRAAAVVVLGIRPERSIEMPPTEDEGRIETLGPDGLDDTFGVGIVVSLRLLAVPAVRGASSSPTRSIP